MKVIRCERSHDAAWNAFVQTSPGASFYHRAEWRDINHDCFGHDTAYLAAVDADRIVGVLPLVRLKSLLFGSIACSMPFVNYGGPCGDSDVIERALLDAAVAVAESWRVDYVELRSRRYLGDEYPCSTQKVSMTLALDPTPDVLWDRFKTGQRQEIRRGYKNGFTAKFGPELVDDFYALLSDGWRELGTPIYRLSYLKKILAAFPQATRVCVVYAPDGTPAAGAFDGLHNDTVEGMWLATGSRHRRALVGYVLYWELIKHACEHGFRHFHLGRSSKDSGGEQFKKKWNAEMQQLYWHYVLRTCTEIPALSPTNPKYQFAINAWQRLPLPLTQFLGPFIARSIP